MNFSVEHIMHQIYLRIILDMKRSDFTKFNKKWQDFQSLIEQAVKYRDESNNGLLY